MKEAMFYKKLEDKKVRCCLCPRECRIADGKRSFCQVRENTDGKLHSLVYGRPATTAIDPIEKKPLFHFFPGSKAYSIGTEGCNLACKHCQNWQLSRGRPVKMDSIELSPEKAVEEAVENDCKIIAYTYNEPTIFAEYVIDVAKIARKKGLKNIMVTNGYISEEAFDEVYKYIDAANVDLKGFTKEFYRDITSAKLEPVLDTLKRLKKKKTTWFEITNLIIPTLNDDMEKIREMCGWIKENIGANNPLHFTAFYPYHQLSHLPPTGADVLLKAKKAAEKTGLKYVYIGNVFAGEGNNTYCPKCKELLVKRTFFAENKIKPGSPGKCPECNAEISGCF